MARSASTTSQAASSSVSAAPDVKAAYQQNGTLSPQQRDDGQASRASSKRRKSIGIAAASSVKQSETVTGPSRPPPAETDASGPGASGHLDSGSGDAGSEQPTNQSPAYDTEGRVRPPLSERSPSEGHSTRYRLRIVQQPVLGSAFGDNLLSRLALAPPLILELVATDSQGEPINISAEAPFLVCQCALVSGGGASADLLSTPSSSRSSTSSETSPSTSAASQGPSVRGFATESPLVAPGEVGTSGGSRLAPPSSPSAPRGIVSRRGGRRRRSAHNLRSGRIGEPTAPPAGPPAEMMPPARMLYGTLAANPMPYESPEGDERLYLLFPEISVKAAGRFKLRCFLLRVPIPGSPPSSPGTLCEVFTDVFEVVPSSDYVAPYITDLTRHFARQGAGLLLPPGQSAD